MRTEANHKRWTIGDNKRWAVLAFIKGFIDGHGNAPTERQIMVGVGYKTPSAVHYQLRVMRMMGILTWTPGQARTIRILGLKKGRQQ